MRKPLSLLPYFTPSAVEEQGTLAILRYKTLQTILIIGMLLGGIWYVARIGQMIKLADWGLAGVSTLLLVVTIGLTIFNSLPLGMRAMIWLSVVFFLATVSVFRSGLSPTSLILIFGFAFTSTLFLGIKKSGGILALWVLATAILMIFTGQWEVILSRFTNIGFEDFLLGMACFFGAIMIVLTQVLMEQEYNQSQTRQQQIIQELDEERVSIEIRLRERTARSSQRLAASHLAKEIMTTLTGLRDPHTLLQRSADLIQESYNLYYVGIFVLDADSQFAVLAAGSGEAGKLMLNNGHRLAVRETSMIGAAVIHREMRIMLDLEGNTVRFNNPYLPKTRSEMALPILHQGQALGALSIQSERPHAFDEEDAILYKTLADHLGVTLSNTRQVQQIQSDLEYVRALATNYLAQSWTDVATSRGALNSRYDNPAAEATGLAVEHEFPLNLRDINIGKIILECDLDTLSTEEKALIDAVATQTAIALENARLLEETQRQTLEERKLNELTEQFNQANSIDEILKSAVRELVEFPAILEAAVHLASPGDLQRIPTVHQPGSNGHHPVEARN